MPSLIVVLLLASTVCQGLQIRGTSIPSMSEEQPQFSIMNLDGKDQIIGVAFSGGVDDKHCTLKDKIVHYDARDSSVPDGNAVEHTDDLGTRVIGMIVGKATQQGDIGTQEEGGDAGPAYSGGVAPAATIALYHGGRLEEDKNVFPRLYDAGARIFNFDYDYEVEEPAGVYDDFALAIDTYQWEHQDCLVAARVGIEISKTDFGVAVVSTATCKSCLAVGFSVYHEFPQGGGRHEVGGSLPSAPEFDGDDDDDDDGDDDDDYAVDDEPTGTPTLPSRVKLDVCAPGDNIRLTPVPAAAAAAGASCGFDPSWTDPGHHQPPALVTGTGLLLRQLFTEGYYPSGEARPEDAFQPMGALLKAVLINSATPIYRQMQYGTYNVFDEGFGIVNVTSVLPPDHSPGRLGLYVSGEWSPRCAACPKLDRRTSSRSYSVTISEAAGTDDPPPPPLKVTLVWSDHPSGGGVLINDLDLEVVERGGGAKHLPTIAITRLGYDGNAYQKEEEHFNPAEKVVVPGEELKPGQIYDITVKVNDLPEEGGGVQPYALAVSGPIQPSVLVEPPLSLMKEEDGDGGLLWVAVGGGAGLLVAAAAAVGAWRYRKKKKVARGCWWGDKKKSSSYTGRERFLNEFEYETDWSRRRDPPPPPSLPLSAVNSTSTTTTTTSSSSTTTTTATSTSSSSTRNGATWHVDPAEVEVGAALGEGFFGATYRARWRGAEVVVKKFKVGVRAGDETNFWAELNILSTLRHPRIVQFLGASVQRDDLFLVMELMRGGSLQDAFVRVLPPPAGEPNSDPAAAAAPSGSAQEQKLRKRLILCDMAGGMLYLHRQRPVVLHRDLNSGNVLLDDQWRAKIADFGVSKQLLDADPTGAAYYGGGPQGHIAYTAPEVLRGSRCTTASDVYSFAVVAWELFAELQPFDGIPFTEIAVKVVTQGLRPPLGPLEASEARSAYAPGVAALRPELEQWWHADPAQRPSFHRILEVLDRWGEAGENNNRSD